MMSKIQYHNPVLLHESVTALITSKDGVYVDVTFGGGGHSSAILNQLEKGRLIAFDQDRDALENTLHDDRFLLLHENFRYIKNFLRLQGIDKVQGVLADLGVSSHQFDEPQKGFTYKNNAPLDMRMNQKSSKTAESILKSYDERDLFRIFKEYGELPNARKLAYHIVHGRKDKPLETSQQLIDMVQSCIDKKHYFKQLSMLFQSLRIEVNDEIQVLKEFLEQCNDIVASGGRLAVISYHSLEDRLVKNFLRYGTTTADDFEKDLYGNILRPFDPMQSKAIEPSEEEISQNVRARSAKLRVGIKR